MPTRLQGNVRLEHTPNGPALTREGTDVALPLQIGEALVLCLLDAYGDECTARELVSECLAPHDSAALFDHVLHRFRPFLGSTEETRGAEVAEIPVELGWLHNPPALGRRSARAAAPEAVTWLVTLGCNRRCPYCFYDVFHHQAGIDQNPADATLASERALEMVREMGRIGAADLYLTGGEPLLRTDLVDIIAAATANRVRTHLVTKYLIDESLAARLAAAGVHHVTVSLDDARSRIAAGLAGAKGYLEEAQVTLRNLRAAGVAVDVNCVVTSLNQDGLDGLARLLVELGIGKLSLGTYSAPSWRRSAQRLVPAGPATASEVRRLALQFAGDLVVESSGSAVPEERPCGNDQVCDVGFTALDVLPDGSVTRCRYLPDHPALIVGNLNESSLLEIWRSKALGALTDPQTASYEGTACHGCQGFNACNSRGRCYYTAWAESSRVHAPDAFCQR
jgi:pyrroloquinoline quinone biosynthesis protein E